MTLIKTALSILILMIINKWLNYLNTLADKYTLQEECVLSEVSEDK